MLMIAANNSPGLAPQRLVPDASRLFFNPPDLAAHNYLAVIRAATAAPSAVAMPRYGRAG